MCNIHSEKKKLQYYVFMLNYNEMMIEVIKQRLNNNSYSIVFPCIAQVND